MRAEGVVGVVGAATLLAVATLVVQAQPRSCDDELRAARALVAHLNAQRQALEVELAYARVALESREGVVAK